MPNLSDKQAKAILRNPKYWPTRTATWGVETRGHYWLRCRPSDSAASKKRLPYLRSPGAELFKTQPDGMWVYFQGLAYADVLVVEVCGSVQNLNDKRSRYVSIGTSLLVNVPARWMMDDLGRKGGGHTARHVACGSFDADFKNGLLPKGFLDVPVRFMRVLFAMPDEQYANWRDNCVPTGHEFFMRHGSMKTATSPTTQKFLSRMSFRSHFLTSS